MCEWKHSLRTSVQRPKIDLGLRVLALSHNELGGDSFLILASVLGLNSNLREVYTLVSALVYSRYTCSKKKKRM